MLRKIRESFFGFQSPRSESYRFIFVKLTTIANTIYVIDRANEIKIIGFQLRNSDVSDFHPNTFVFGNLVQYRPSALILFRVQKFGSG